MIRFSLKQAAGVRDYAACPKFGDYFATFQGHRFTEINQSNGSLNQNR
jgi:hypothetical protein